MSLIRFATLTITLIFILMFVGMSASSSNSEPLDQHVIHLPLIDKQSRWSDECIDCPHYFWDRSLDGAQLDSTGRVHVAYGGEQLYYAYQNGTGQWVRQVVDYTLGTGTWASLAMDSSDQPHILYYDEGNEFWKYAFHVESGWLYEILYIAGNWATIVIDNEEMPHIAYISQEPEQELRHGYRDVDGWHFDVVDSNANHLSLAVDSFDHLHIVYNFGEQELLKYATYDGSDWTITTIGNPEESGAGLSLVLDSNDNPHISYVRDNSILYTFKNGSEWQIEAVVEDLEYASDESSLKLDQSGTPFVLYTEWWETCIRGVCEWDNRLVITYRNVDGDGNWIDPPEWVSLWALYEEGKGTLLIDASNGIHVVAGLRLYSMGLGSSTIDVRGFVHGTVNLSIDRSHELHATYAKNGNVAYGGAENGNWHFEIIGALETYFLGGATQLALGPTDEVAIVYPGWYYLPVYPGPPPVDYRYFLSRRTESGWNKSMLPEIGYANSIAIAVDSQGVVHFSYLNSNGLHYWYDPTSGVTTPQIVDIGPGHSLAMLIDASNRPCIAYHLDGSGLKYTCRNGNEWETQVVRAVNAYSISLGLDSASQPHIVYVHGLEGTGEIKHATTDGNSWQIEPVAWINGDVSMAFDGNDYLHLSYRDGTNDIIHAYRKDAGWLFERINTSGYSIVSTVIAVDSLGNPQIAYIDDELHDLRIIHYEPY